MANPANNPLFKHFRQPAIYLKLPGNGQFWPDDAIDMPTTGEIPIYPMTVVDEITIKTPDALMNGLGVVDTIQSCCPNIKNAWKTPLTDLDAILIAIRLASYGPNMDIESNCPTCQESNTYSINLQILLDNLKIPNYKPIKIDNLTFNFKPQEFETTNNTNMMLFEQRKLLDAITNSDLTEEEKTKQFNTIFPKLTEMNVLSLVYCIQSIVTDDGTEVTEFKFIKEFIENCDRNVYAEIKKQIEFYVQTTKPDPLEIECSECQQQYQTDINFDNANFFG